MVSTQKKNTARKQGAGFMERIRLLFGYVAQFENLIGNVPQYQFWRSRGDRLKYAVFVS